MEIGGVEKERPARAGGDCRASARAAAAARRPARTRAIQRQLAAGEGQRRRIGAGVDMGFLARDAEQATRERLTKN